MLKSNGGWPNDMCRGWENMEGCGNVLPGTPGVFPIVTSIMDCGEVCSMPATLSDNLLFLRERDLRGRVGCCGVGDRLAKKSSTLWGSGFWPITASSPLSLCRVSGSSQCILDTPCGYLSN